MTARRSGSRAVDAAPDVPIKGRREGFARGAITPEVQCEQLVEHREVRRRGMHPGEVPANYRLVALRARVDRSLAGHRCGDGRGPLGTARQQLGRPEIVLL